MTMVQLRSAYHRALCEQVLCVNQLRENGGYPNLADGSNRSSVQIAWGIAERLGCPLRVERLSPQAAGRRFEACTCEFLRGSFELLQHVRPGTWHYSTASRISAYDQYAHLSDLEILVAEKGELATILGTDYVVQADILIARRALTDAEINARDQIVDEHLPVARHTPLRQSNLSIPRDILHASISCKWTLRSDRGQNARTEALNLVRLRKGNLPHIVAVTAEPLPTRIASLALGTGDLDCVYHVALHELESTLHALDNVDQADMLGVLVDGRRLRDISDLPFDLAV